MIFHIYIVLSCIILLLCNIIHVILCSVFPILINGECTQKSNIKQSDIGCSLLCLRQITNQPVPSLFFLASIKQPQSSDILMHVHIDFSIQPYWFHLIFDPSLIYNCNRVNVVYPQSVEALWGFELHCPFDVFTTRAQH